MPAAEAAAAARREGDRWIARATPILGACGKPYTIIRWDQWLRHVEFPAMHEGYSRLAQSDAVLSAAIAADIEGFMARQAKHGTLVTDADAMRAASRAYLLEELAAITLQGRVEGSARLYPGPELASFHAVRRGRVIGAPAGLERDYYVHINLERRKAPSLQPAMPSLALKIA